MNQVHAPATPLRTIVGLGELLWDLLLSGPQLGGAPANFAYCTHLLGNRGVVASRIGADELGREARQRLLALGLTDQFLQVDPEHPTSTVKVRLNTDGQPTFEITDSVAWDFLESTSTWEALARSADAVCFGSLAQRHLASSATIQNFLDTTRPDTLRIFDVNLRQSFYSREIIAESLQRANIVKLNHEEVPIVANLLGLSSVEDIFFCGDLIYNFDLQLVCVTRGGAGSLLLSKDGAHEHAGFTVQVADAVGAGDAFTAGLVHEYLLGSPLEKMNDTANRIGAWVASQRGAMPPLPKKGLASALALQLSN
jgi:fructokinase